MAALVVSSMASIRQQGFVGTRRAVLWTAFLTVSSSASAAEGRRMFTNLDDAREAGDALREKKERAEGPIVTLASGVKFRELEPGSGESVLPGDVVSIQYIIYRLNGMYLDSVGYGKEGKDDVGETFNFVLGDGTVPRAIELGMEGMRVGGKRRILVRPELGWINNSLLPRATTTGAQQRLKNSLNKPLLFEVEVVKTKHSM